MSIALTVHGTTSVNGFLVEVTFLRLSQLFTLSLFFMIDKIMSLYWTETPSTFVFIGMAEWCWHFDSVLYRAKNVFFFWRRAMCGHQSTNCPRRSCRLKIAEKIWLTSGAGFWSSLTFEACLRIVVPDVSDIFSYELFLVSSLPHNYLTYGMR